MTHVTCRLTAKNRDRLRNPTLSSRVWATFLMFVLILCSSNMTWVGTNRPTYYAMLYHAAFCHSFLQFVICRILWLFCAVGAPTPTQTGGAETQPERSTTLCWNRALCFVRRINCGKAGDFGSVPGMLTHK